MVSLAGQPGDEPLRSAADIVLELPSGDGLAATYGRMMLDGQLPRVQQELAAMFSVAERHLEAGSVDEALELAFEAVDKSRADGGGFGEADALRLVFQCFAYQEKHNFALQMAEEELGIFQNTGNTLGQAKMLLSMAELSLARRGQDSCKKALDWADEALRISRNQQEKTLQAAALLVRVKVRLTTTGENFKGAVKCGKEDAQEALALLEDAQDKRGMARALHLLGAACAYGRNTAGALQASNSSRGLYKELDNKMMEAFELQSAATWSLIGGDPAGALPDAEKALALFRDLHCGGAWEASALGTVARAHCGRRQQAEALSVLRDGLQRLKVLGDPAAEARAMEALANTYLAADNIKGALNYAERARSIYRSTGNKQMECLMLRTLSRLQMFEADSGVAIQTAHQACALGKELQNAKEKADSLVQLARAQLARGLFQEAQRSAEDAQTLFETEGDKRGEGVSLLTLGLIRSCQDEHDQAGSFTMQAYTLFREAGPDEFEAQALLLMCEIQIARGAWEKASKAAEKARDIFEDLADRPREVMALLYQVQANLQQFHTSDQDDVQTLEDCKLAALAAAGEAVSLSRTDEDNLVDLLARSLYMLVQAQLIDQRPQEALEDGEEALDLFRRLGDVSSQAATLDALARANVALDRKKDAEKAANDALVLFSSIGAEQNEAMAIALLDSLRPGRRRAAALDDEEEVHVEESALSLMESHEKHAPRSINLANLGTMDTSGGVTVQTISNRLRQIVEELHTLMIKHLRASKGLYPPIPKSHLWHHLTFGVMRQGNPLRYSTFLDEHVNGILKVLARSLHQITFEWRAIARLHELLHIGNRGRFKRRKPRE